MGGREDYGNGLENRRGCKSTVSSNLTPSAKQILYEWMIFFLEEDDRSRDWTLRELLDNLHKVRPEIRRYIFAYHIGGFDLVFKLYRPEIYEMLGIEIE